MATKSAAPKFLIPVVIALVAAVVPAVSYASTQANAPEAGSATTTAATPAQDAVAAMQPGWNLGNTFDATGADETSWGNPVVTQELITSIKAQGFNSIRIPVTWGQHQAAAPDYTIEAAYLARVQEVVQWALDADLYVMINIHHDSWQWVTNMPAQHDTVLAQYTAIWTQLATAFSGASDRLLFESINEQAFTGAADDAQSYTLMNELNTTFFNIVRESGGNNATRLLVLPTLGTSPDQARIDELNKTITALNDPNIIATVHFYGYWPFSTNIAGGIRFDATAQQDLIDTFDRVYNSLVANGIPVIIGEYGLLGFDKTVGAIEQGEKLKYFEFLGYYARLRGITTMLWDNGQHFNRTTLEWNDQALYDQIRSSWTERSGTASTDQLFVNKTAGATDETVTLNLNGTTLTGIAQGDTALVEGTDYTVSGDQLTFTAAALTRLSGDQAYGVNTVLTATFSAGVPWSFNVITYDTPVLSDASGTTTSLVIPTAFNGDQLATMEAKYADGTAAGPQNWTTFKEFAYAFSPDYTTNQITLTEAFFAEVNDGTVTLTFHFWSGELINYTITKSGTTVTGTAS